MVLNAGEIVDKYQIIKYLDSGKAGDVYKAKTIKKSILPKNKIIVMKIYKPYILELQDQITRIESEAKIGMNINGKNLVKIYDYNLSR